MKSSCAKRILSEEEEQDDEEAQTGPAPSRHREDDRLTDDPTHAPAKPPRKRPAAPRTTAAKSAATKSAAAKKTPARKVAGAKPPARKGAAGKSASAKSAAGKAPPQRKPRVEPVAVAAFESSEALKRLILGALDEGKAEDVIAIDLAGKTSVADAMVIASGRSNTQVFALADRIAKAIKEDGRPTPAIEGLPQADWVLIDAGDVVAHIFRPEVRAFYNLEKMWGGDRPSEPQA